jgi:hypothetical protein
VAPPAPLVLSLLLGGAPQGGTEAMRSLTADGIPAWEHTVAVEHTPPPHEVLEPDPEPTLPEVQLPRLPDPEPTLPEVQLPRLPEPDPEPTLPEVQPSQVPDERASPAADMREGRAPPPRARARALGGFARVSGSIGRGIVPSLDGGLALGAGLLAPRLRAELVAFHIFAQDAHSPAPSPAGATVTAWGGSLRLGPRWQLGPLELHALASVAAAALTATGFGVDNPRRSAGLWMALGLVPGLRWRPSPRVAVGADLEAEAALYRPGFTVGGLLPVYRAAQLGVRGSVVVELRWGGLADRPPREHPETRPSVTSTLSLPRRASSR